MRSTYLLLGGAALLLWGAACTNDFGQFDFDDDGAGGAGGDTSTSTTTASGMGGMATSTSTTTTTTTSTGSGGCDSPVQCPGMDTDCNIRVCENMVCGDADRPAGLPCNDDGGNVCDGMGSCVECVVDMDCEAITDGACDTMTNTCLPAGCMDGLVNGMETDVDCGGPMCNPCMNTMDCMLASDCQSNLCNSMMLCEACTLDTDCLATEFCDAGGVCTPKGILGDACGDDDECTSGFCPGDDGVCCDTTCGSLCESCLMADTGQADGTCAPVTGGTDPKSECTVDDTTCTGDFCAGTVGACEPAALGTVCRMQMGMCDVAESCDGTNLGCPVDDVAAVGTTCRIQADLCDEAEVCDGANKMCPTDAKKPNGTTCRISADFCDAAEVCDGTNDACPVDALVPDGGTPVGVGCGNYLCDGAMASCPGTCGGDGDCTTGNTCQGTMCLP